ncbi:hypothetical protein CASFOL_011030 [Castilleja foliolosa]|uniref:Uncharacterized protein n=1 Tax=Castilleja foliolosa TaxID=1961234 RepID=A0ABD3DYB8_9LAMI
MRTLLNSSSPLTRYTTLESSATIASDGAPDENFSPPATIQHSPWHSPIPYLFGGLAAMLGLIAISLIILACSYWKLSGDRDAGDIEGGGDGVSDDKPSPVFEEKLLVIMAGQLKPTFLATPTLTRINSSLINDEKLINSNEKEKEKENGKEEQEHHNDSNQESQLSR